MTKICPECGCEQKDKAKFCSKCGVPFKSTSNTKEIEKQENILGNKKRMALIIILIIIIALIIAVTAISLTAEKITISNIEASSFAVYTEDTFTDPLDSSIDYFYYVDAIIEIEGFNKDISQYSGNATFYNGNTEVRSIPLLIEDYYGTTYISGDFTLNSVYDVDNVKIDVYNSDGKLVKSVNTTFTMGDMTNPI